MHTSTLDGVTVLSRPGPGPLSASLMFAAGVGHATFRTQSLPHLLEHMIAGSLPRGRFDANASTGSDRMTFDVTGTPEEVRGHLKKVCAAIRDVPLARRAHEARVVTAEAGTAVHPGAADSAITRYGLVGPGLVGAHGVPADQVTDAQILEFARRHLVAGNAVLSLTGEIPEGLRLDLPSGGLVLVPDPWRMPLPLPGFTRLDIPQVTATVEVPDDAASALMLRVWMRRSLDRLRHELGVTYSVDMIGTAAGGRRAVYGVTADGAESDVEAIADGLIGVLRDLAAHGATTAECAEDLQSFDDYLADADSAADVLAHQAVRVLTGLPAQTPEESRAELASVGPDGVRDIARAALPTLLIMVPDEPWGSLEVPAGFTDLSSYEKADTPEVDGRIFAKRLLRSGPRDTRIRISEDGISMRSGRSCLAFAWEDVVGVDTSGGLRQLIGKDMTTFAFEASDLKDGATAERLLDERLGALLFDGDIAG